MIVCNTRNTRVHIMMFFARLCVVWSCINKPFTTGAARPRPIDHWPPGHVFCVATLPLIPLNRQFMWNHELLRCELYLLDPPIFLFRSSHLCRTEPSPHMSFLVDSYGLLVSISQVTHEVPKIRTWWASLSNSWSQTPPDFVTNPTPYWLLTTLCIRKPWKRRSKFTIPSGTLKITYW